MPDEDILLSLCINSCRKRFLRLKNFCDIAEFLRVRGEPDWNVFARKARERRCSGIACAALFASRITFGAPVSLKTLTLDVGPVQARIIRYLFSKMWLTWVFEPGGDAGIRRNALGLLLAYASHGHRAAWGRAVRGGWRHISRVASRRLRAIRIFPRRIRRSVRWVPE